MRLTSLSLEQFRSYERGDIAWSNGDVFLLVGSNGAGKTNILEAIAILSLGKSFQGTDDADLIRWGTEYYRIRGEATDDTGTAKSFEVVSQIAPRKQRASFMNDVRTSVSDMVGQLPTVTFLPQDLHLFSGAPAERRRFLDQLLCQVSPQYLRNLSEYGKILKQRNALLKALADRSMTSDSLDLWDERLAQRAAAVTLARIELIEMLQCTIGQELVALGETWNDVQLSYERKGTERDIESAQQELIRLFRIYRDRDIMLQSTTVGPHREDWQMLVDGRPLPSFASRGQQRTAVLALLFLQVSYLELRRGEKPIILLDDVFSELDDAHQSALLASLEGHQVIISSTHIPLDTHGATVLQVGGGRVAAELSV